MPPEHLTHKLGRGEFIGNARNVLRTLVPVEREVMTDAGTWYLLRVHPYRTAEDRIDGVVLTFVDIDRINRSEAALRESEARLRRALAVEAVGVIFFQTDGGITDANDAFLRLSGYTRDDLANRLVRWDTQTPPEWTPQSLRAIEEFLERGYTTPYEKEYLRKDGTRWWDLFAATRLNEHEGVEFIIDITRRQEAEGELRVLKRPSSSASRGAPPTSRPATRGSRRAGGVSPRPFRSGRSRPASRPLKTRDSSRSTVPSPNSPVTRRPRR